MRYSIALLALLPALVAGHPFERRNTASTAVGEEELSTVPVASYGDTTSSYAGVTSSNPAYTTSSYAGVTSSNPAYSSAPTSYASSNGQYASSSGGAALCTMSPSCGALTGSGGAASGTVSGEGAQATCPPNSWDGPGMATIRLTDVHLKWGPPNDTNVKDVFGSADWFNFPFWCSETEFTIYAFPDGTSSQDMSDTSQCTYQKTCKLSGFSQHGDIPVVQLDFTNAEPYVQATDLTGAGDVTINAECGPMQPPQSGSLASACTSSPSGWTSAPTSSSPSTYSGANYAANTAGSTNSAGSTDSAGYSSAGSTNSADSTNPATTSAQTTSQPTTSQAPATTSSNPSNSDPDSLMHYSAPPSSAYTTSSEATTSEATTSAATTSEATTSEATTSAATTSEATTSEATTSAATTSEATTSEATTSSESSEPSASWNVEAAE